MLEEVKELLRIEYGKDCGGIIMDYIYPKCEKCKELFEEDKTFNTYNDKYVCIYCYNKFIYNKCYRCAKMYEYCEGEFCKTCKNKCKVFCCICLIDELKGFQPQLTLMSSIIDVALERLNTENT